MKDQFSASEWQAVSRAPYMAALFVIGADVSGRIGIGKEAGAVAAAIADEAAKPDGLAIAKDIKSDLDAGLVSDELGLVDGSHNALFRALSAVESALAVVDAKSPSDAPAFGAWLHAVATRVAESAKEGGAFGIGGVLVSDDERKALDVLASTLGVRA